LRETRLITPDLLDVPVEGDTGFRAIQRAAENEEILISLALFRLDLQFPACPAKVDKLLIKPRHRILRAIAALPFAYKLLFESRTAFGVIGAVLRFRLNASGSGQANDCQDGCAIETARG
jgi:hypothetical protein